MSELLPWLSPLAAIAAIVISLVGNRSKAHDGRISAVELRVDKVEDRMTTVEQTVPSTAVTHRMEVSITEIKGEMHVLAERLKPVSEIATRLQDYMLNQAGGK